MCIDIACDGGGGNRIAYGFLFKNDLDEFIYSCSRCDEEFRVGNDLEQHSIGHDIKEENDMLTHAEMSVDLEPTIEVFAEAPLPPPTASLVSTRPSRYASRKTRSPKTSRFPLTVSSSPPLPSTTTAVKAETASTAHTKTKEEMSVYLPFDIQKLEVNIEKKETDTEQNESLIDNDDDHDDDDEFTPFAGDTSSDDDFFTPAIIKQASKQKEATATKATAATASSSLSKKKKTAKKDKKDKEIMKDREYHCDICGRVFTSLARIQQHMVAGHIKKKKPAKRPPSPTLCTLCGKHIRDMKTHLKIFHSTERPFKVNLAVGFSNRNQPNEQTFM